MSASWKTFWQITHTLRPPRKRRRILKNIHVCLECATCLRSTQNDIRNVNEKKRYKIVTSTSGFWVRWRKNILFKQEFIFFSMKIKWQSILSLLLAKIDHQRRFYSTATLSRSRPIFTYIFVELYNNEFLYLLAILLIHSTMSCSGSFIVGRYVWMYNK